MNNTYTAGQVIEFTATFTDDNNAPVDPTTVVFKYKVGTNPTVTLTYAAASVPAVGIVARMGVGVYEAQVDTTGLAGSWVYQWQSTGVGQTIASATGIVEPTAL